MFFRVLVILSVFFLISDIKLNFLQSDYFNIKKIVVKNSKIFDFELTTLAKKIYNSNKYKINFTDIKNILSEDARLENIEILDGNFNEIIILLKERELKYYANIGNKIYMVDSNGVIFGYFDEHKIESIPIISSSNLKDFKRAVSLLNTLKSYHINSIISQIKVLDANLINIILTDGTIIKTNEKVDSSKYGILEILYSSLIKEKKIEYIDLRFDNYIVKFFTNSGGEVHGK